MIATPAQIKFALWKQLAAMAQGATITGLHSICTDGQMVSIAFDVAPSDGEPLYLEFERPAEVGGGELEEFAAWLMLSSGNETVH